MFVLVFVWLIDWLIVLAIWLLGVGCFERLQTQEEVRHCPCVWDICHSEGSHIREELFSSLNQEEKHGCIPRDAIKGEGTGTALAAYTNHPYLPAHLLSPQPFTFLPHISSAQVWSSLGVSSGDWLISLDFSHKLVIYTRKFLCVFLLLICLFIQRIPLRGTERKLYFLSYILTIIALIIILINMFWHFGQHRLRIQTVMVYLGFEVEAGKWLVSVNYFPFIFVSSAMTTS